MSWPSNAARTKTWGTEVLTASDLQGQFDLLCQYFIDSLNGTTGHGHTGGTNDGPKIPIATSLTIGSQAQGDVIYASSSSAFARLGAGTAGQALTTGGASANPAWAGMTTQGDVEYNNGTTRTRLAPGTSGQFLQTQGAGANPQWANVSGILGAWSDVTAGAGSAAQAATDGFLVGYGTTGNGASIQINSDSSNPPTTIRALAQTEAANTISSLSCMVKKNDYYKFTSTGTAWTKCYFIPIGA